MSPQKRDFQRAVELFEPPEPAFDRLVRRRERRDRRRRIEAGILALVVVVVTAALLGRAFETSKPANEPVQPTLHADKPGIWIVDPVSGTTRFVWGAGWIADRLRPFAEQIGAATMSPGGDRIAFAVRRADVRDEGLWTVSSTGQDLQQVCPHVRSCIPNGVGIGQWQAWSPDGRSLAFAGGPNTPENPSDIYAVNVDGTEPRKLESMPGEEDIADWSPDGDSIVFDHGSSIYVASVNGGSPVLLVRNASMPMWSPDGSWIAFVRGSGGTDLSEIWLVHPDGTGKHVVSAGEFAVGWSQDGSQLAILRSRTATLAPDPHVRRYAIVDLTTGEEKTIDIETPDTAMLLFRWSTRG
jgi:dipeptidyl aminopeptidase/acylaminoacyl peptidase